MTGYTPGVYDISDSISAAVAGELAGGPGIGPGYGWYRELTEDIAPDKEDMRYTP